ncbi:MAG TPA: hypothetical protein VK697_04020, partial [Methylomirabilota bacterium]|nr:hypothetical protein [Methylomirabilota bacterium]
MATTSTTARARRATSSRAKARAAAHRVLPMLARSAGTRPTADLADGSRRLTAAEAESSGRRRAMTIGALVARISH